MIRSMSELGKAILIVLALSTIFVAAIRQCHAQTPLSTWFNSLRSPVTGSSCCDTSDCKRTEMEIKDGHYRAAAPDGTWHDIPPEIVIHDKGNPTGEPILCANPDYADRSKWRLLCFVPGAAVMLTLFAGFTAAASAWMLLHSVGDLVDVVADAKRPMLASIRGLVCAAVHVCRDAICCLTGLMFLVEIWS